MNRNIYIKISIILFFLLLVFGYSSVKAFCPVCTVAAGAGLGLSRWLKIDDTVTGIWIGGFLVSTIGWLINWLKTKKITNKIIQLLIAVATYFITIAPLYWQEVIGHPYNKIYGIDKLAFGIIIGTVVFILSYQLHLFLKKGHGDKSYFPMQKVAIPISVLLISSLIMYFMVK